MQMHVAWWRLLDTCKISVRVWYAFRICRAWSEEDATRSVLSPIWDVDACSYTYAKLWIFIREAISDSVRLPLNVLTKQIELNEGWKWAEVSLKQNYFQQSKPRTTLWFVFSLKWNTVHIVRWHLTSSSFLDYLIPPFCFSVCNLVPIFH